MSTGGFGQAAWSPCTKSLRKLTKGNIVNWEEAEWSLSEGMEFIEQTMDDVCLLPKPKNTIFPEDRTNRDMHQLCNKLKGHMTVTDGQAKQDRLTEEFKNKMPHLYGVQCKLMM